MKIFHTFLLGCAISTTSFAQNSEVVMPPAVNQPALETKVETLVIDASDKTNFVYLGLSEGKLVPVEETDTWIFGVRRYIFKTQTGSNGEFTGGTLPGEGADFETFTTCAKQTFAPDEVITMLGYTISANPTMTSEWYDYDELGAVTPLDKFFAISRDTDCLKLKILSYQTGVYEIQYEQLDNQKIDSVFNETAVLKP